ncbi:DUF4381 family protein [Luteimonas sp. RD2P54]|uniref:DUF4381 family protein n=1 Tax=Luteimonas endophytica TaxID=3042023 RepID=A0ABT6J8H0_9GAMM|nr:DUF4381 family protein [Luteimonas endophytica]MDH5822890.1 DUF4381 family protein [Luteimonas endophytica]
MNGLVLRDIHEPPGPGWWPPAPGWWLLALVLLAAAAILAWWLRRRRLQRRRMERMFDDAVDAAATPAEAVAAISELLRRAARRRDPGADALDGEDWLRFLDRDARQPGFDGEEGRLLLTGGYRREVDARRLETLRAIARARFLEWTTGRR